MKPPYRALSALTLLLAAAAHAGPVNLTYENPDKFTDVKLSYYPNVRERDGILEQIKQYVEKSAPRYIPAGTTLDVKVTDVDLAGDFEMPMRAPGLWSVRIVKDIYPPRMDFSFRLSDDQGKVLREGTRKLVDNGFLIGNSPMATDLLRFEKSMLDDWLRKEFPQASAQR